MKKITLTADWILSNCHHTLYGEGNGYCKIICSESDNKWNKLALDGIHYEFIEYESESWEIDTEYIFKIEDIKKIAPEFHKVANDIDKSNAENNRNRGESV